MASLRFAGRWHDAVSDEDPQACSGLFRTRLLGGYVAKELGVPEKTVRKWGYSYQALGRQAFLKGNPKTYSYTKIKDNQGNYVARKPVVVLVTDGEPQQFMSENW